jgi:hypothetical protein
MNYLPPYQELKDGIAIPADGETITMSRDMFRMLIEAAAKSLLFDPEWYRTEYPDVAAAIESGDVESEIEHYASFGYEEGRMPAYLTVDESRYLTQNSDVAQAIEAGEMPGAETHFNEIGYLEGRAPDAEVERQAQRWARVIAESAQVVHPPRVLASEPPEQG